MLGYALLGDDVHMCSAPQFLNTWIPEYLKQSCYWVLWHAGPFRNFIQFSHVSLHIAIPLAKIPYQIFKTCIVKELYFIAIAIRSVPWNFPLRLLTQNRVFKDFAGIDTIIGSCICTQVWYLLIVKSALPATDLKSLPVKGKFSFLTEIMFSLHKKSL